MEHEHDKCMEKKKTKKNKQDINPLDDIYIKI